MMLKDQIMGLAGPQRANTFEIAMQAALAIGAKNYVETGCYRGIHFDGQSTKIWAILARETGGHVTAIDISPDSIDRTRELLGPELLQYVTLILSDSLVALPDVTGSIDILYLDSYDHDPDNPLPCQEHQLKEAQICLPKMGNRSMIILDDCKFETGGKCGLSDPFIRSSGWELFTSQYQNVYQRENNRIL